VVPVTPIFGAPSRVKGLDGWPDDAYPRKIKYQVTLMESALELCRQGGVAGYFPTFIVDEHNGRLLPEYRLARHPSPYADRKCYTDVFLVKRKSDEETAVMKQLAKAIRLFCR
jgi:DNA-binding transcriptional LysR family regulator